jgi:hypothetical protein
VDADVLRAWLDGAELALEDARGRIDAVNVFPVADGDTGTNVLLTVRGAAEAVRALDPDAPGEEVLRVLARGALLAARGNSGVIVSRYLAGLAEGPHGALPDVLARAAAAARTAVHEPEDGTVLTVAARVAAGSVEVPGDDAAALRAGAAAGRADLVAISAAHPVLHRAGVVDAGACALLVLLEALAAALGGADARVDVAWLDRLAAPAQDPAAPPGTPATPATSDAAPAPDAFEVMAVLHGSEADCGPDLRAALAAVGDAVAVVDGDGALTAHVHTADPAAALVAVAACGGRWTSAVRGLTGEARAVVACTAHPVLARALARTGATALVVPDGVPVAEVRSAVRRAVQDAGVPAHAPTPTTDAARVHGPAAVLVLPGDRLDGVDPGEGWTPVPGADDDLRVLAALGDADPDARPVATTTTTTSAPGPDAALAAAVRLAAGSGPGARLTVLLGPGAATDDGLDLVDRFAPTHPGVRVEVAGPVPAGPAFRLALTAGAAHPATTADPSTPPTPSSSPAEARP